MTLTRHEDLIGHKVTFVLVFNDVDYVRARFDAFDYAVIADCEKPDATVADHLLALELIARRIQESRERATPHGEEE